MNDPFETQPTDEFGRFLQEYDLESRYNNAILHLGVDERYQLLTEKMSELLASEAFSAEPSKELLGVLAERNNRRKVIFNHFGLSVTEDGLVEIKLSPREEEFARIIRKVVQEAIYCTCSRGKGCEYHDDNLYCIDCGKVVPEGNPIL